jgi:hypothetical protein
VLDVQQGVLVGLLELLAEPSGIAEEGRGGRRQRPIHRVKRHAEAERLAVVDDPCANAADDLGRTLGILVLLDASDPGDNEPSGVDRTCCTNPVFR